jgi:hypothetical protein
VVRIAEQNSGAGLFELERSQSLDGRLRADCHKGWSVNNAVRCVQQTDAGCAVDPRYFETGGHLILLISAER